MAAANPFAAPEAVHSSSNSSDDLEVDPEVGPWRLNGAVVARSDSVFPNRCIRSNQLDGLVRKSMKLTWVSGWYFLLFLMMLFVPSGLGILFFIVLYFTTRKTIRCELVFSRQSLNQRLLFVFFSCAALIVGILAMSATSHRPEQMIAATLFAFLAALVLMRYGHLVRVKQIKNTYVVIEAPPEYVASLPPFPRSSLE